MSSTTDPPGRPLGSKFTLAQLPDLFKQMGLADKIGIFDTYSPFDVVQWRAIRIVRELKIDATKAVAVAKLFRYIAVTLLASPIAETYSPASRPTRLPSDPIIALHEEAKKDIVRSGLEAKNDKKIQPAGSFADQHATTTALTNYKDTGGTTLLTPPPLTSALMIADPSDQTILVLPPVRKGPDLTFAETEFYSTHCTAPLLTPNGKPGALLSEQDIAALRDVPIWVRRLLGCAEQMGGKAGCDARFCPRLRLRRMIEPTDEDLEGDGIASKVEEVASDLSALDWTAVIMLQEQEISTLGLEAEHASRLRAVCDYVKRNCLLPLELIIEKCCRYTLEASGDPTSTYSEKALTDTRFRNNINMPTSDGFGRPPNPEWPSRGTSIPPDTNATWERLPSTSLDGEDSNQLMGNEELFFARICACGRDYAGLKQVRELRDIEAWAIKAGMSDVRIIRRLAAHSWHKLLQFDIPRLEKLGCDVATITILIRIFTYIEHYGVLPENMASGSLTMPSGETYPRSWYDRPPPPNVDKHSLSSKSKGKQRESKEGSVDYVPIGDGANDPASPPPSGVSACASMIGVGMAYGNPREGRALVPNVEAGHGFDLKCWIEVSKDRMQWSWREVDVLSPWDMGSRSNTCRRNRAGFISCHHDTHFRVVLRVGKRDRKHLTFGSEGQTYDSLHIRYVVDGRPCGTHFIGPHEDVSYRYKDGKRDDDKVRPFVFCAPNFISVAPRSAIVSEPGQSGLIRVEVRRARRIERHELDTWEGNGYMPGRRRPAQDEYLAQSVRDSEKGLISSVVGYDGSAGRGMNHASLRPIEYLDEDVDDPMQTFTILYRTEDWLDKNEITKEGPASEQARQVRVAVTNPDSDYPEQPWPAEVHDKAQLDGQSFAVIGALPADLPRQDTAESNSEDAVNVDTPGAGPSNRPWKLVLPPVFNPKKRSREEEEHAPARSLTYRPANTSNDQAEFTTKQPDDVNAWKMRHEGDEVPITDGDYEMLARRKKSVDGAKPSSGGRFGSYLFGPNVTGRGKQHQSERQKQQLEQKLIPTQPHRTGDSEEDDEDED